MPIPFIIAAAAVAAAGAGTVAGISGAIDMSDAKEIGKQAEKKYKRKKKKYEAVNTETMNVLAVLGKRRLELSSTVLADFLAEFRRLSAADQSIVEGLNKLGIHVSDIKEMKTLSLKASEVLGTGAKALGSGAMAGFGALGLATMIGSASTGTALSSLSGAAAYNAMLAYFGGGSLAAGGMGMAGGSLVLGSIFAGPAIAIGGFFIGAKGSKALAKANKYSAEVDKACAKFNLVKEALKGVQKRSRELDGVLAKLGEILAKQVKALKKIRTRELSQPRNRKKFMNAAIIAKALSDVIKVQVMTKDGKATKTSLRCLNDSKRHLSS